MSDAILGGLMPYRDFFVADPPFFVYLLSLFKLSIGGKLILFKTWPIIFDSLSAALVYLILKRKGVFFAALGPVFYLFSFTILSTSDYVTGAELTIFLMLLGIYLDLLGKPFWSGVSWAASCLSKLYAAPALIGFMLWKLLHKEFASLSRIIMGGLSATFVVLLPSLISVPKELWHDLITHQFNRPAGLDKWNVFRLFIEMEWLLIALGFAGTLLKKGQAFLLPFVFSAAFFLLFRDLYYLYLQILMPFLAIGLAVFMDAIREKDKDIVSASIAIAACIALYPVFAYMHTFAPDGIFADPQVVALSLQEAPENLPVYGPQEIAPLVALMSSRQLFRNIIDTNTQNFASGTHDRSTISNEAVENGIYLVAEGEPYLYFDNAIFKTSCSLYKSFPGDIAIYKCYRSSS